MGSRDKKMVFSSGWRFREGLVVTAIMDPDGTLTLKDPSGGSLEVFRKWADYVKDVTGDVPANGNDEDAVVDQLSLTLGRPEQIGDPLVQTPPYEIEKKGGKEEMTTATAPKPVKVPKAPKAQAPKAKSNGAPVTDAPNCLCGCGVPTGGPNSRFRPGHDSRVHSWFKKIQKGEMKMNELNPALLAYAKDHGITQGKATKA